MRRLQAIGAVALALVGPAMAGCGDDEDPAPPPDAAEAPAPEPAPEPAQEHPEVLTLSDRGTPVLQVRHGRRVELYDRPDGEVLDTVGAETEFGSRTAFAVDHAREGWAAVPTPLYENGRLAWVRLDPKRLISRWTPMAVEIDLSEFRAELRRGDRVVRSFPISIGMPEAPTPTGEFAVTDTFRGDLNPAYGCCAIALTARQTRLPSGWLGGDRIAIHGTYGTLGAAISHGCVRAADEDVSVLVDRLPPGAPVTIRQ